MSDSAVQHDRPPMKCGGVGESQYPVEHTHAVHKLTDELKPLVEAQTGKHYKVFKAVETKQQLVNGVNHFIKVHLDGEDYIHIRAHKAFSGDLSLTSVQENKKKTDPLDYF